MQTGQQIKADLALIFVTFVWGTTFVVVQNVLSDIGPYYFLAIRFTMASALLAFFYYRRLKQLDLSFAIAGIITGTVLFSGYAFQTIGLKYTTAANSGFITGLCVVFVPLILSLYRRKIPQLPLAGGVLLAATGLGLLSLGNQFSLNYGDILTFFCAIGFALHILAVAHYTRFYSPELLTILQIAVVAVLSALFACTLETPPPRLTLNVWLALLVTAVLGTALAFLIQNKVQKFTSPVHTAVIFTAEPVFAALTAYIVNNEQFTTRKLVGCALILTGMLLCELKGSSSEAKTKNCASTEQILEN
ncbi:MAG: DMT family transporter [Bacillota bacterium]|uniref:DMT family transporter n=1 Tax=Desulfurispora thermophila TaxID=265470 RepID=UPI00036B8926|nr:DMT family transporter [Desulfurispora thermophila]